MVNSSPQWLRNAKRCRRFIIQVSYISYISRLLSQSLVQRYLCEHDQRQIYEARNIILGMQYVVAASGPWAPSAKTSIHLIGAHWLIQRNGTVASDFWDDKSTSLLVRVSFEFIQNYSRDSQQHFSIFQLPAGTRYFSGPRCCKNAQRRSATAYLIRRPALFATFCDARRALTYW